MPDEFQNIKNQYPEFFKDFPPKLLELVTSDETASKISDICLKNGVKSDEAIEKVSYIIISVLLGRLPQEILSKALVTNLGIDAITAKRISEEADRLIFSLMPSPKTDPLTPGVDGETPGVVTPPAAPAPAAAAPAPQGPPAKPHAKDIYREQI